MKRKLPKLQIFVVFIVLLIGLVLFWHRERANAPGGTAPSSNKTTASSFNKSQYSTDAAGSLWWLVNKNRPLNPLNYAPPDLASIGNGQQMRNVAAAALTNMFTDAKAAGYNLIAESGYRSYATQISVYNNEVAAFGQAKADTESAKPGYSEHQTGWAVDIGSPGCYEDCFGKTAASTWLLANSYKYGFILRYPTNKSDITGYRNEPWHFRYVGKDLALELHSTGQVMEEFFNLK